MQTHTEENHVKRQGEDGHLHAKERGPRRNQACWHLELRLLAPELRGNKSLLFKSPSLWYFTKAVLAHYCTRSVEGERPCGRQPRHPGLQPANAEHEQHHPRPAGCQRPVDVWESLTDKLSGLAREGRGSGPLSGHCSGGNTDSLLVSGEKNSLPGRWLVWKQVPAFLWWGLLES